MTAPRYSIKLSRTLTRGARNAVARALCRYQRDDAVRTRLYVALTRLQAAEAQLEAALRMARAGSEPVKTRRAA